MRGDVDLGDAGPAGDGEGVTLCLSSLGNRADAELRRDPLPGAADGARPR